MEIYKVVWWNGFVREIISPLEGRDPEVAEDETLEEKEFSSAEKAVRFFETENCRRYGELFPESPCFCFNHFNRRPVFFLQTIPYWDAVEEILRTKTVKEVR